MYEQCSIKRLSFQRPGHVQKKLEHVSYKIKSNKHVVYLP